jgi:hypothetical protein
MYHTRQHHDQLEGSLMSRLFGLSLPVILATPAFAAPITPPAWITPSRIPGGVADAAGKIGFIANDKNLVEAINLETGEVLWTSEVSGKPLAVSGNRLLVQVPVQAKANAVRVVALNTGAKGKQAMESDPVVFPDWVATGLAGGKSFTSSAKLHQGDLLLTWEARSSYWGGARPPPEVERAARKEARGVARVNLETGKVEMVDADKAPVEPAPKVPEELAKVPSHQYFTGTEWKRSPLVVGTTLAALVVENEGSAVQKMKLQRWDLTTGKALGTVELLRGKALWSVISPDGRTIAVHQALVKEQLPEGDYAWWVFDTETGKQLAKFLFEPGSTELTVIGPRAYYAVNGQQKGPPRPGLFETPRLLKAIDLKTGKQLWERNLPPIRMLPPPP